MSDGSVESLVLEGGILTATVIGLIITGVWQIAKVRDDLREEFGDDMNDLRKQVIETMTAMRERTTQIELYIRDNYVSKETFNTVTERILAELRAISEKFDSRSASLENKIITYLYENRGQERSREPPK